MGIGSAFAAGVGGGCTPLSTQDSASGDSTPPPDSLELPSLEGIDFVSGFQDVMRLALGVQFRTPWDTHLEGLGYSSPSCPDWYLGNPDPLSILELSTTQPGVTWWDFCREGDHAFGGYVNLDTSVDSQSYTDGSYDDNASRSFAADGTMSQAPKGTGGKGGDDEIWFHFDGTGRDSLFANRQGKTTNRWIYNSVMDAAVTGTGIFPAGSEQEGGYRTDMALTLTGGDENQIDARGNVLYEDHLIQDRFDSFELDVRFQGALGAGPQDCLLEPLGWMGLRDQQAYWYDLVFLPRYDNDQSDSGYPDEPYASCDGCGTLYVRGVDFLQEVGEVCVDFSSIWGSVTPPTVDEFIWNLHD